MEEKNKKYVIIVLSVLIGILIGALLVLYFYKNRYEHITTLGSNEIEVLADVGFSSEEKYYYVRGWSCILGETIENVNVAIILWNEEEQRGYVVPTILEKRPDVTAHFQDGYNYDNSGFVSYVRKDRIDQCARYQIFIRYRNNGHDEYKYTGKVLE